MLMMGSILHTFYRELLTTCYFPLNAVMASQSCCIVNSDGWIGVNQVDKVAM